MKAMAQKRSTPPLLVCWLFLQKKIRGLARSKRRKKTSVWLFPLLYITRESGTIINYRATTLRATNNLIRILINGDERESLHVIR